jgi:hypothetical protein
MKITVYAKTTTQTTDATTVMVGEEYHEHGRLHRAVQVGKRYFFMPVPSERPTEVYFDEPPIDND